jgi:hypothetical protein
MSSTTVFVGVAAVESEWNTGFDRILELVRSDITALQLRCRIVKYVITDDASVDIACEQFLRDSNNFTKRAFVAGTATSELQAADAYLNSGSRRIPVFSLGASASSEVIATTNAVTWMPLNRTAAMMIFILHTLYNRSNFFIVYDDEEIRYRAFIRSYIQDLMAQAAALDMTVCVTTLSAITTKLPDDSTIVLLASNEAIAAKTSAVIDTPTLNSSIAVLTDINAGALAAWFGDNIVPLCMLPYSLNTTTTTQNVFEALGSQQLIANAYVYAFYDCLFGLAKFSLTKLELNLENFVRSPVSLLRPGPSTDPLPAYMDQQYLSLSMRSPRFGKFVFAFVKPALVENPAAFLERFLGGNPLMPDSLAVLYQIGVVPWFNTRLFWDENPFVQLRSTDGDILLLEKFGANNARSFATDTFRPPNNGQDSFTMGIEFDYDPTETTVPILVKAMQLYNGPRPMTQTLGKTATVYHV